MAKFMDVIRLMRGLSEPEKESLSRMSYLLSKPDLNAVERLLKQKKISIEMKRIKTIEMDYPSIQSLDREVDDIVQDLNDSIKEKIKEDSSDEFSSKAFERIAQLIAPNIVGMEHVKKAAVLQLFAVDHLHILLLGDPGTGKTDILRSVASLHPISSFGLGSGTTGAGLAVTVKGNEISKGLLPMADGGIACIDELNLMKEDSRAAMYNAMEKGFITYDKGGKHHKFDARVSVIATANPKGDKFTAKDIGGLKKQLPFDSALLTRFHLVFLIKKPDKEAFKEIARGILKNKKVEISKEDLIFVKDYVAKANEIKDVHIPPSVEHHIVDAVAEIKTHEEDYLIEISPRLVVGLQRMVKASARAEMRKTADKRDIDRVREILTTSLSIR